MVTVLVKKVGETPEVQEIDASLEAMKKLVGGYIEHYLLDVDSAAGEQLVLVMNEEGQLRDLTPNVVIDGETLRGDIFLVRAGNDGSYMSLTATDAAHYAARLQELACERLVPKGAN